MSLISVKPTKSTFSCHISVVNVEKRSWLAASFGPTVTRFQYLGFQFRKASTHLTFKLSISKRSLLLDSGAKSLDFAIFSSILLFPAQPHTSSPSFSSANLPLKSPTSRPTSFDLFSFSRYSFRRVSHI